MENTTKLQKDVMIEAMFSSPAPGGAREYRVGPLPVCKFAFQKILGIGNSRVKRLSSGGPDDRFGPRPIGDPRGHRPEGFTSVYTHLWNTYNSIAEFMPDGCVLTSARDPTQPVSDATRRNVEAFNHAASSGPFGPGTDKLILTPTDELPEKYLPPGSKRDHWWTYLASQPLPTPQGNHASYTTFKRVWKTCFEKVLKIRAYSKFSTCNTCAELKQKMRSAATHAARCQRAEEYARHLEKTWRDRQVYWRMRGASGQGETPAPGGGPSRDWLVIIIDGADQAKFRVMKAVAWPKAIAGEHRPKMKVVGALAHGHEMSFNFVEENVPKGSNLIIEVLAQCLERILSQSLTAAPPHLWVQVDNAGGENKNQHVMRLLSVLVDRAVFRSCVLSFLQVGHTHEDIDGIFGMMAKGIQQLVEWDSPQQMSEHLGSLLPCFFVGVQRVPYVVCCVVDVCSALGCLVKACEAADVALSPPIAGAFWHVGRMQKLEQVAAGFGQYTERRWLDRFSIIQLPLASFVQEGRRASGVRSDLR